MHGEKNRKEYWHGIGSWAWMNEHTEGIDWILKWKKLNGLNGDNSNGNHFNSPQEIVI